MDAVKWSNLQRLAETVVNEGGRAFPRFWADLQPRVEKWVRNPAFLGRVSNREDYCRDIVILVWEKLQENDYSKLRAFFRRRSQDEPGRVTPGRDKPGQREPGGNGSSIPRVQTFRSWLFRVVKNIGIDYMRKLPEYLGRSVRNRYHEKRPATEREGNESEDYWYAVITLHSDVGPVHKTHTSLATARELLEFLDTSVPTRQRNAAELHRDGASYERIATEIGLPCAEDAERIVQRSLDRLRYRTAMTLWSQNYSWNEIAEELGLDDPGHARRIVNAAKELLKRQFRR